MDTGWWVVMIEGEYAATSDLYGPYRTEKKAQQAAEEWNRTQSGPDPEMASVLPIRPPREM